MEQIDVVVMDDDEGICWILKQILMIEKIACITTCNVLEGIELIKKHHPRLVLLDLQMGAISGLDVAKQICCLEQDIKIVFITGYIKIFKQKLDQDLKIMEIIEKPFDALHVLDTVRKALC